MGEVIVENEKVLDVHFVCATAVQSQLFSFADLFSIFRQFHLKPDAQLGQLNVAPDHNISF